MESSGGYEQKLLKLEQAIATFEKALAISLGPFSPIEQHTLKSGQIQKFEVCTELFWKTARKFLYEIHGIEALSPKMTMKLLYQTGYTDEIQYENLLEMINDRNRLSHIYNEEQFRVIYERLPAYLDLMKKVLIKSRV